MTGHLMITGCNALVTGGSSGVGAAIAEGLAAAGCAVTVLGRDRTRLTALAYRLDACALVADLSTAEGLSQAVDAAKGVDLLVTWQQWHRRISTR
jgi:NADP-dependent 3-hydroxy acid dehydrogenase YdfG